MENCIFCKIINKEIPSSIVYEDKDVIAFLDISQLTKGHTLIVPKKHFSDITEIDEKSLDKLMHVVRKLSKSIMTIKGVKGINIINNCKEIAGQSVKHIHFHIIPRYKENEINLPSSDKIASKEELEEVKELIIKAIK